MTSLVIKFQLWMRSRSGATAIEYALLAGLIALVIITAVTAIGQSLKTPFTNVSNGLS